MRHHFLLIFALLVLTIFPALAQDDTDNVTADEVNAIAKNLYCPVCEGIPLDTCGTAACVDWRNEIRLMLLDGKSESEITDDFVMRFGDRVVGIPQSDKPRRLSLLTPYLLLLVGVILAAMTLFTWRRGKSKRINVAPADLQQITSTGIDQYRQQLEQDLLE